MTQNIRDTLIAEFLEKWNLSYAKGGFMTTDADGSWIVDNLLTVDWLLSHHNTTLKEIEEDLDKMKPILWNDDPNRHLENIAKYNTLDEVKQLIHQKLIK